MGITPQLLRVCERLAAEGYAVAAPDLFWRFGGSNPEAGGTPYRRAASRATAAPTSSRSSRDCRDLGAATVGITGFCMGGGYAYLAAVSGVDVDAAAPFYGGGIAQHLGEPYCPLLCFFGGRDEYIPRDDIAARREDTSRPGRRLRRRAARLHARRLRHLRRGGRHRRVAPVARILRRASARARSLRASADWRSQSAASAARAARRRSRRERKTSRSLRLLAQL